MRVKLDFGAELDVLTQGELEQSMSRAAEIWWQRYRAATIIRIPLMTGVPAGGKVAFGLTQRCGPGQGWAWGVRELNVEGLTGGATPDVVNIYRGSSARAGTIFWQLNGNQFLQTFGRGDKILKPGETLYVASAGTFTATGPITLSGVATQVPAERAAELVF